MRGDERVRAIWPDAEPATEADWATEYLDLILAVRVVDGLDEALAHIAGGALATPRRSWPATSTWRAGSPGRSTPAACS